MLSGRCADIQYMAGLPVGTGAVILALVDTQSFASGTSDLRIVVLLHENEDERRFFIHALADVWRQLGMEVEFVRGIGRRVPADVAINHVNLSVTPPEYLEYLDDYECVINRAAVDMSKRNVSTNLLGPHDEYDGPVIVKTDRNFGGGPEARLLGPRNARDLASRVAKKLGSTALWLRWADRIRKHDYRVFPSLAAVPRGVFKNPALVVERFLPEKQGDLFSSRIYLFLGDRYSSFRVSSPHPVIKSATITKSEEVPLHEGIVEIRRKLGYDFGKFDYAVHDGKVALFDANRGPGFPRDLEATNHEYLARGILSLLPRETRATE
jgi:hypothetical protein